MRPPDGNIAEARLIVLDNALDCPRVLSHGRGWKQQYISFALVVTLSIIMQQILSQSMTQRRLTEQVAEKNHTIQTFILY